MNTLPVILSLTFFGAFSIYAFFGFYILDLNIKSPINRVFFMLCVSLCLWSFSFSISNSAHNFETVLFWRRVSAIGWGTVYSFLLHFTLILTEKNKILQKKWLYLLIYLPAAVTVFSFSLYGDLAVKQYNLVYTTFGWSNISVNNLLDWFFNIYYISYCIIVVYLVWEWGRTSKDQVKKEQARLLLISFALVFMLGSFTDIISNSYLLLAFPQIAPVIILIFISTILFCIRHYNLMTPVETRQATEEGRILNETVRKRIYHYLALIYILGSFINFGIRYFIFDDQLLKELLFSSIGILIALSLRYIHHLKIKEDHQDTIFMLIVGASIPYIAFRYINYSGVTVWAIPFIFVVLSVVFNRKRIIFILTAFILFTQIWVWLKTPVNTVTVTSTDHFVRLGMFSISIWLAFYINKVYIKRLRENEDREKEINYMAYYDSLTGLPNRTLFNDRLSQAINLSGRIEKLVSVFFIDLDSFKAVNDTMGHAGGDELIKKVASRLLGCVRKHDTVARFGGDEFLIMLTNISRTEDILKIADKVSRSFIDPLSINGQEFYITASIGISIYPVDGEESEDLIKNADLAMYSSKEKGKNQYSVCSPVMKELTLKKMKLTNSLYRALERNEFMIYYQPQISVATEKIIGLEALIRWNHPHLGMISPGAFIPLAEQTGLINPIGEWVLMSACEQNMVWQKLGLTPVRMAVNLSVEQLRNPKLSSALNRILGETGMPPEYLELEITESAAVKEENYLIHVLNELKELRVTIAIDDFGSEYSSLNRLKILPVDRIKMDMQFVQGISINQKDEIIATVIIQLGKSLGLSLVAEGVETKQQRDFLFKQGCDEIQGYYYYKPMPPEEIEKLLLKQLNEN